MSFKARQQVDLVDHGYTWLARVKMAPFIHLIGRDELSRGQGQMKIKLLTLFKVVDAGPNTKMNSASLIRYLAEMYWYPSLAVNPSISWKEMSPLRAQATLNSYGLTVSGIFEFDEKSEVISFESQRYRGGDEKAEKEL